MNPHLTLNHDMKDDVYSLGVDVGCINMHGNKICNFFLLGVRTSWY